METSKHKGILNEIKKKSKKKEKKPILFIEAKQKSDVFVV